MESREQNKELQNRNLYSAPKSNLRDQTALVELKHSGPADRWLRFFNYVIDSVFVILLVILFEVMVRVLGLDRIIQWIEAITPIQETILTAAIYVSYYVMFEGSFGRTIGKFITGTVVINEQGEQPRIGQIFIRSICRYIPFEPLSLFQSSRLGWHDTISNTMVVKIKP